MGGYCEYKSALTVSLVLLLSALLLTAFSLFSPLWQISTVSNAEHEHGLWWDCVISTGQLIPLSSVDPSSSPLPPSHSCAYKGSSQEAIREAMDSQMGDKEALLHRFLPQHKAVLFFGVFTFLFGFISIVIGVCSPCFPPNSLLFVVAIFMTTSCSLLADVIFLFATQREGDRRKVEDQSRLGLAAYIHMSSTLLFSLSLLSSVVAAYLLISCGESRWEGCCASSEDFTSRHNSSWRSAGVIVRTCDKENCNPFVEREDSDSQ